MGEVDDVHHAPDEREAHGGEPVHRAHQHTVGDRGDDSEHDLLTAKEGPRTRPFFAQSCISGRGTDRRGRRRERPDHLFHQLAVLHLPLREHHLMRELQSVALRIG